MTDTKDNNMKDSLRQKWHAMRDWIQIHVPPGLRLVLGILLICCGIVGFLPIVGFWMIPLGIAVAAMDVRPLWKRVTKQNKP